MTVGVGSIIKNYKILDFAGQGTFAKVYKAVHLPTNQEVAIKVMDALTCKKMFENEVRIMRIVHHPFIIKYYDSFIEHLNSFIVMEYLPGLTLMDHVNLYGPLGEQQVKKYFMEIISAMDYLNSIGVVHRDIKAENIILDDNNHIRLIDFGFATNDEEDIKKTQCGSPSYAAPEIMKSTACDNKIDIWSIGICLYAFISGSLPFYDLNAQRIIQKVLFTEPKMRFPNPISNCLKNLLQKMLRKNPSERIDIKSIITHPWVCNEIVEKHLDRTYGKYLRRSSDLLYGLRACADATSRINECKLTMQAIENMKPNVNQNFAIIRKRKKENTSGAQQITYATFYFI